MADADQAVDGAGKHPSTSDGGSAQQCGADVPRWPFRAYLARFDAAGEYAFALDAAQHVADELAALAVVA